MTDRDEIDYDRGSLVFTDPVDVLVARRPAQVLDVMREAERRVKFLKDFLEQLESELPSNR